MLDRLLANAKVNICHESTENYLPSVLTPLPFVHPGYVTVALMRLSKLGHNVRSRRTDVEYTTHKVDHVASPVVAT